MRDRNTWPMSEEARRYTSHHSSAHKSTPTKNHTPSIRTNGKFARTDAQADAEHDKQGACKAKRPSARPRTARALRQPPTRKPTDPGRRRGAPRRRRPRPPAGDPRPRRSAAGGSGPAALPARASTAAGCPSGPGWGRRGETRPSSGAGRVRSLEMALVRSTSLGTRRQGRGSALAIRGGGLSRLALWGRGRGREGL